VIEDISQCSALTATYDGYFLRIGVQYQGRLYEGFVIDKLVQFK
jgi:hypothetical protein